MMTTAQCTPEPGSEPEACAELPATTARGLSDHHRRARVLPGTGQRLAGVRVLVVDDDRNTREIMTEVLRLYGAEARAAGSAAEALAMVQSWVPDLTLCDVGMPEEDGYQFICKLRALPGDRGGAMPVIALTGYVRPEDRSRVLDAGYQMFLAKPADLEELIAGISNLMSAA